MKKAYQQPVSEIECMHLQTLMSIPSVGGGSGIDDTPGKGSGDAPSGPGAKVREEDLDPLLSPGQDWGEGLW